MLKELGNDDGDWEGETGLGRDLNIMRFYLSTF